MSLTMISIDAPKKEQEEAEKVLARFATRVEHPLTRIWLVESADGVDIWRVRLETVLSSEDRYLIVPAHGRINGILPRSMWDWVNKLTVRS